MKKKKKWIKFRHKIIRNIAYVLVGSYTRLRCGVKVEPFREQNGRQYLIILNHQTVFDQFFVGMTFSGPIYYLATEDIFSNGWISRLLSFAIAPIPIKKQTTDIHAVMKCLQVVREGGTIALAPEGNRTYSGRTGYIKPSIVKLARALKLPIAIFRVEGGYGVQPRWSDVVRKGDLRAYVSRVVEHEEYSKLSDEEMYQMIQQELFVDEACTGGPYHHKKRAEYLERAMYVCPVCGLSEFESHRDQITCKKCGKTVRYLPNMELSGVGSEFPFRYIGDWYDYQCDFVNHLDLSQYREQAIYQDTVTLSEVILYKTKRKLQKDAKVSLYGDRIVIDGQFVFYFDEISTVTVLGRNKLNIYHKGSVYQFKGSKRFNALKYVNIFYRYKNIQGGNKDGKFWGL